LRQAFRRAGAALAMQAREETMLIDPVLLQSLAALAAGILILLVPRMLNYIVAIYLIVFGVAGLVR
jgi:hypothetical protein